MLLKRVIPVLLLKGRGLVKTIGFKKPVYVGDPINTVRIFNEKEVDEIIILDIYASREKRSPNYALIEELAGECFMPLCYGGGISNIDQITQILSIGVEKISLNLALAKTPELITEAARRFGSQAVVASIDAKKTLLGGTRAFLNGGSVKTQWAPVELAKLAVDAGAGEILINSIEKDGTCSGYDLDLIESVANAVSVPVIACGGAGSVEDFKKAVSLAKASAVAAGSIFVFHGPHRAVLINVPERTEIDLALNC